MKTMKYLPLVLIFSLIFLLLGACDSANAENKTSTATQAATATPAPTLSPEEIRIAFYTGFDVEKYDYSAVDYKLRFAQSSMTKEENFAYWMRNIRNSDFSGQYAVLQNGVDSDGDFMKDIIYTSMNNDLSGFDDAAILDKNGLTLVDIHYFESFNIKMYEIKTDGTKEGMIKALTVLYCDKNVNYAHPATIDHAGS